MEPDTAASEPTDQTTASPYQSTAVAQSIAADQPLNNGTLHGPSDNSTEPDDEVVERDPTNRFCRYAEEIGAGRFKQVFKGFDEAQGIDVAWSKIHANRQELSESQVHKVIREMEKGLLLDHPNIIKCYMCWADGNVINLITELFTSGNLRSYRRRNKHVDSRAIKKWAKQVLKGLKYLHEMQPPVVHGDLRCDKIYVNGHSGEIKIGDLGLATLLPYRFAEGTDLEPLQDVHADVFAFGLCMLELLTLQQLDPSTCDSWQDLLNVSTMDPETHGFIAACLGPAEQRPSASELLESSYLVQKPPSTHPSLSRVVSETTVDAAEAGELIHTLRGEEYKFMFKGYVQDGKAHFDLTMEYQNDDDNGSAPAERRRIGFDYDPAEDTADKVAQEIAEAFGLGETDTSLCAAAIKEWLANHMPGVETNSGQD